jgi:hypothetical protein
MNVWKCGNIQTVGNDTNDIYDEIKSSLNSGNVCYRSVQNFLSSRLISKNLKIKIYRTVVLPFILYGCETWSPTLREEHRLRVFENRVLRRLFGRKREEDGSWRKLHRPRCSWGIVLKWVLKYWGVSLWTGFNWLIISPLTGCCEYGNERSCSKRDGESLD